MTVRIYGKEQEVQAAAFPGLWYGSFGDTPGQLVLMREPDSKKPCDLGLFTLDTGLSLGAVIERYSWRWPIEPSNAAGKQVTGAGDACNRIARAVERAVPFAFLVQSLMIRWYAISCDPAAGIEQRRQRSPWYTAKATPAAADMHAALRDALTQARINAISPGSSESRKSAVTKLTSKAQAALLRNTSSIRAGESAAMRTGRCGVVRVRRPTGSTTTASGQPRPPPVGPAPATPAGNGPERGH
jgi:hypothetical protein